MLKQLLLILPVFVAGVVLGVYARQPEAASPAAPAAAVARPAASGSGSDYGQLEEMISSLTEIVNLEVAERRRLEAKVDELQAEVRRLGGVERADSGTLQKEDAVAAARERARTSSRRSGAGTGITVDRFVEAGFSEVEARDLKRQMDELTMERLYLRDQAVREGWLGSQRYRDALRDLNARQTATRDDLGDEAYDKYLYALGRPNRIVVSSVLSGSPADAAGMQDGDVIVRYDNQRMFSPSEIRRETSRGSAGAVVPVEVDRGGESVIVYLPRGPLGVQMSATSDKP